MLQIIKYYLQIFNTGGIYLGMFFWNEQEFLKLLNIILQIINYRYPVESTLKLFKRYLDDHKLL